ncbi:hypothetical protein B0H11DRAFT_2247588 [Mycena galericulata]|nr:hypothetical protein B0H11DRAFT_2247588 [Mycena galericulata]
MHAAQSEAARSATFAGNSHAPESFLCLAACGRVWLLHDWSDVFAQRIRLRLHEAAAPRTQLVLADWVLRSPVWMIFGIGIGSIMGLAQLLLHGRTHGGSLLDFGRSRWRGDADGDSENMDDEVLSGRASLVLSPGGSVLAAAARIEHGIPRSPSPDP